MSVYSSWGSGPEYLLSVGLSVNKSYCTVGVYGNWVILFSEFPGFCSSGLL